MDLHEVFGHCGVNKLVSLITQYYYFPDIRGVCTTVCETCLSCQKLKKSPLPLPLLPTNKYTLPFRCWALDFLPNLPETPDGFKYILLCVDPFSKWIELIPTRTKSSKEVYRAIELYIFARFGVPLQLRVDRGLEFAGEVKRKC